MSKYALLREKIHAELGYIQLLEPQPASDGQLALAHHPDYIAKVSSGSLSAAQQRAIGFPWSAGMVERSRRSVGASIGAAQCALRDGVAVNLAGGTHHAYADRGEGFCCFNDFAVAARLVQSQGLCKRVLILDLDVHQGNGSASILARDNSVFTFSMHGDENYPFKKEISDWDIGLQPLMREDEYCQILKDALPRIVSRFNPDFVLYLAGADVYADDRLGTLGLSVEGIEQRDQIVCEWAQHLNLPIAAAMGGGYCKQIEHTVQIHFNTVKQLSKLS
jgi:acetoin utilization deacetylase AcuC-like enzyme